MTLPRRVPFSLLSLERDFGLSLQASDRAGRRDLDPRSREFLRLLS